MSLPITVPIHTSFSLARQKKNKQTCAACERQGKRKLPEAGTVAPVEFRLSGGGGAGRLGRVRVCGMTAAARKEKRVEQRKWQEYERKIEEEMSELWWEEVIQSEGQRIKSSVWVSAYPKQWQTSCPPLHRSHWSRPCCRYLWVWHSSGWPDSACLHHWGTSKWEKRTFVTHKNYTQIQKKPLNLSILCSFSSRYCRSTTVWDKHYDIGDFVRYQLSISTS